MGTMSTTVPGTVVESIAPASGSTYQMANDSRDGLLSIVPAAQLAILTINVPDDATSRIGQARRVFAGKAVMTLTIANATIYNAPASLALGDSFTLVKVAANTWAKF